MESRKPNRRTYFEILSCIPTAIVVMAMLIIGIVLSGGPISLIGLSGVALLVTSLDALGILGGVLLICLATAMAYMVFDVFLHPISGS